MADTTAPLRRGLAVDAPLSPQLDSQRIGYLKLRTGGLTRAAVRYTRCDHLLTIPLFLILLGFMALLSVRQIVFRLSDIDPQADCRIRGPWTPAAPAGTSERAAAIKHSLFP